jgi:hypothetical protein
MKLRRPHHREISYAAARRVRHQHATLLTEFQLASTGCGRSASFAKSASGDSAGTFCRRRAINMRGARPILDIPREPSLDT